MVKKTTKVAAKKKSKSKRKTKSTPVQSTPVESKPEPQYPLASLRAEVEGLFDRYLHHWPDLWSRRLWPDLDVFKDIEIPFRGRPWDMSPRMDMTETDKTYEITAELPGLDEKDLDVSLSDDVLTIKGEKREEREKSDKDYHLKERRYGNFRRTFRLPEDVDTSKVDADFSKGLLKVVAHKSKQAKKKGRNIPVRPA
ncbi:MAG: Hsp20/alpha crystallin family protein [Gammaproteobacteria bacterium]|nr:Hsp20/alpha crystallin family protein [Gammaproteobacteria bacterium]